MCPVCSDVVVVLLMWRLAMMAERGSEVIGELSTCFLLRVLRVSQMASDYIHGCPTFSTNYLKVLDG
jgi:hypothetical protein